MMKKSINKLICFIVALVLISCFSISAYAEQNGTILIFSKNSSNEQSLSVPIKIEDCKGIISLIMSVEYNTENLQLQNVQNGDFFKALPMQSQTKFQTPYKIYWENSFDGDVSGDGTLCVLNFKILNPHDFDIKVTVEDCFNKEFQDIKLNTIVTSQFIENQKQQNKEKVETEIVDVSGAQQKDRVVIKVPKNLESVTLSEIQSDGTENGIYYEEISNGKVAVSISSDTNEVKIEGIKTENSNSKTKLFYLIGAVIIVLIISAVLILKAKKKQSE